MVTRKTIPPAAPDPGADPPGPEGGDQRSIGEQVKEAVGELLGPLLGSGKLDVTDDGGGDSPPAPGDAPVTLRQVEDAAAAAVRRAQDEIARKGGEGAGGAGAPATAPPAAPPETPPQTATVGSWLRKLLFGDDE